MTKTVTAIEAGVQTSAWMDALELARRSRLRVRKELGGRPLISPEEMIRADREERSGQLTDLP